MAATLVTGLIIEAIQKIGSSFSRIVLALSRKPTACRQAPLPLHVPLQFYRDSSANVR
jgi:hypothetical protein